MDTLPPHADSGNPPEKRCTGPCGRMLPATTEFFHQEKKNKDGLQYYCKACVYEKARAKADARKKTVEILPPDVKRCSNCKNVFPKTDEFFYRSSANKDGFCSRCKGCRSEEDKEYRAMHAEEIRKKNIAWRNANRERVKARKDRYNLEHREQHRQYLIEHKEKITKQSRAYYATNRDRILQWSRQYYSTDHGRMIRRLNENRRRAHKIQAGGRYTKEELVQQLQRQKGKCYYCKTKLGKDYHADHIVPLSRGGGNSIDNIVVTCPSCNLKKKDKLPHEWREGGTLL